MYRAVDQLTAIPVLLMDYALTAATSGKEALGQVAVKLEYKGQIFAGRGVSTDVLAASLRAYIHAINKIEAARAKVADFSAARL
jgi:2-isopropylmalate synthase